MTGTPLLMDEKVFPVDIHLVSIQMLPSIEHLAQNVQIMIFLLFFVYSIVSFVSMCFVALYLMGKLHVFSERGRGQSWRLIISITPLFLAMLVAVSRTCDYHHHWQDVTVGSLIGIAIAYVCYRQYYPALDSKMSHRSYADLKIRDLNEFTNPVSSLPTETKAFLAEEKDTKWI